MPNEQCDGQDNDCDGSTDEGVLNICGGCGSVPSEQCDGVDNDCDEEIDEAFPTLGQNCQTGVGECARNGQLECNIQGGLSCNVSPSLAQAESCDQKDNDCDGAVDEDYNFDTDANNCGRCNRRCVFNSDVCIDGACVCGEAGVTCGRNEECIAHLCINFCGEAMNACP